MLVLSIGPPVGSGAVEGLNGNDSNLLPNDEY